MKDYEQSFAASDYPHSTTPWMGSNIKHAVIEKGIENIGQNSFFTSEIAPNYLESITIAQSVKSIGDNAFLYCFSLTSVTIPNSVTSIGSHAFYSCNNLTSIDFEGTKEQWSGISKDSDAIPAGVTVRCTDGNITTS